MHMIVDETLEKKEVLAKEVIKNALQKAKNPVVCFSGGKKSVILLHLIKAVSKSCPNILFIDTGVHFEQINNFIEKMRKLWGFNLIIEKYEGKFDAIGIDTNACCQSLIYDTIIQAIRVRNIDYLFVGGIQNEKQKGILSDSPQKENKCSVIYPIFNFNDGDILAYIQKYKLLTCSLYSQGYLKVDCMPCSSIQDNMVQKDEQNENEILIKEKLKKLGYL